MNDTKKRIVHKNDCIFCQVLDKKIPSTIRYEDDDFIAIDDINPKRSTHVLVISKEKVASLEDASPELITKLMMVIPKIAKKLNLDSYQVEINVGAPFQVVFHLHAHIMGGDKV